MAAVNTAKGNTNHTSVVSPQTQVKVQLSTRQPDISLPEPTGPILVNTSRLNPLCTKGDTDRLSRFTPLCPLNPCQRSVRER